MSTKMLCTADFHLGRSPTRVPPHLGSGDNFSPRAAFAKTVALAKKLQVEALLLTGDLVDESNAFFEAHSALASGIQELTHAGIKVYAVSGNHDFEVLCTLAETISGFRLLGANGRWAEEILECRDQSRIRLQGKCFTARCAAANPLEDYQPPADQIPTLALLHCDVNAAGSPYAPVLLSELEAKAPTAWLLGHIHKPTVFSRKPLILYPGSLQGMDPGETGAHGPWLLTIDGVAEIEAVQFALAPLRYEAIEINLQGAAQIQDLNRRVVQSLKDWEAANSEALAETEVVACRLMFKGSTGLLRELPRQAAELEENLAPLSSRSFVEKVIIDCQPEVSLEKLAEHKDPPGLLARKLLVLRERAPEDEYRSLLVDQRLRLQQATVDQAFALLDAPQPEDDETLRVLLLRAGSLLLDELLNQKNPAA